MNILRLLENAWQDFRHGARLLRLNSRLLHCGRLVACIGHWREYGDLSTAGRSAAPHAACTALRKSLPNCKSPKTSTAARATSPTAVPTSRIAQWEQIRNHQQAFSSIFAWGDTRFNLSQCGEARFAEGLWVSGDFFKTLGVQPLFGRSDYAVKTIIAGCGSPGAVISYAFWQREFGGDPQAIGKKVVAR